MGIYFPLGSAEYGYQDVKRSKELEDEEEGAGDSCSYSSCHPQTPLSSALKFKLLDKNVGGRITTY